MSCSKILGACALTAALAACFAVAAPAAQAQATPPTPGMWPAPARVFCVKNTAGSERTSGERSL